MEVIVEDKQLSLAIGKKGQNVRLAAKLTGWKIDIKSEEEKRREVEAVLGALEIGDAPAGDQAPEADNADVESGVETAAPEAAAEGASDVTSEAVAETAAADDESTGETAQADAATAPSVDAETADRDRANG